ncbi:MAG: RNA-binding transcriptional accessory protein [Porphyromonadaceae bacterium CG2_30_38_12]|nr:MAG: RNA-binding transcriptional accessory protein [Porphyromonadaceae bacterium CG2_30_38_12]
MIALHPKIISLIASKLSLTEKQVRQAIHLFDEGATIPFISRYRKEMTDNMDEVQLEKTKRQYDKLCELVKRKELVLKTIADQNKLTDELHNRILSCWNATELEDIYLPFKPKRRTRAEIAREKGLEPLARQIMKQNSDAIQRLCSSFINEKVKDGNEALLGAQDIIAEWITESESARNAVRKSFSYDGVISSKLIKVKEEEAQKYRDYFDMSEKLSRCSSHRLLAMRRGEAEGFLRVAINPNDDKCIEKLERIFVKSKNAMGEAVFEAAKDSYKRLLKPSIETEFASESKLKADTEAIRVFAENLRQLLFAPPLGQKRVLGIDPGFRTGCKVVCLDAQGSLIHNETMYPHPPQNEYAQATRKIQKMVEAYDIQAIAIGNGTAGRESEHFIQNIRYDREVQVFVVSENGASIYSASKIARDEFPDYDVTVRGAVSIGRRLMDPLAELVKIEPKSIGVGQYQHDVDQTLLKKSLDQTVQNAVNRVGVNLNTASKHLLLYISGLGAQLAQNIVDYRTEIGAFKSRKELMQVPKMGTKTFEQCAGFLRIQNGDNPLDNSAVHPESYQVVEQMAKDLKVNVSKLIQNKPLIQSIDKQRYITDKIGLPTLTDILAELEKPGRDPRESVKVFEFDASVKAIADLRIGMELPGIVTNITNFGAFVDIGIKENGLIHISNMSDKFISNPTEIVSVHQHVKVQILEVDSARKRVQLKLLSSK